MSFLEQVLQKTKESGGNSQEVYDLLKDNSDKLNDSLADELLACEKEEREQIALTIATFSHRILSPPLGSSQADNIEIAITGYKVAQRIYAFDDTLAEKYAWIQNALGHTYSYRIEGERAENLELAIKAFELALKVRTREKFPEQWVETQQNLGIVYCHRIRGNKANNLKEAIKIFKLALKVCTSNNLPELSAKVQNEIGNIYLKIENIYLTIEKTEKVNILLIEAAIKAFKSALKVYSCENYPYEWATTQNHIGIACRKRNKGDKHDNQAQAIKAFKAALEIFSNDSNEYGRIQNNLGSTYLEKINGNKTEDLECAIKAFKSALQIYICNGSPQELAITLRNLGFAYLNAKDYHKAYELFADSINIVDFLRWEIIFGSGNEADKQYLAEQWNPHYQGMLEACLNLAHLNLSENQPDYFAHAIEYAERSKARNLVELLNKKNLYPQENLYNSNEELYKSHCKNLDKLRTKILKEQWQKQSREKLKKYLQESSEPREEIEQPIECINKELEKMMQERDELIQEINKKDTSFKFTQKLNEISFSEIKALVDKDTAIVEWYIGTSKIITFIITHNENGHRKQKPLFWESSPEDLYELIDWCKKYFEAYYEPRLKKHQKNENEQEKLREKWRNELTDRLQELAEILHIKDIVDLLPKNCKRLILVPHRFLHLLPLHALPLPKQKDKYLLDKFEKGVGYAPSCQLLQISQELQRTEFNSLFAVHPKYDKNNLSYHESEVGAICELFSSFEVLGQENAKEEDIKGNEKLRYSHCCHFSCHGEFDLKSPIESALLLAEYRSEHQSSAKEQQSKEDGRLTLSEIFELRLDKCRLVTLSACETGMVDPDSISDEYIGLPSGFMFAGSPSVVASLWKVGDASTPFLMSKFYENLTEHMKKFPQLEEGAVAIALNQAQCWLRDVTNTELKQKMENLPLDRTQTKNLNRLFNNHEKPFSQPYYWAAFCAIGK